MFLLLATKKEEEEEDHGGRGATGERALRTLVRVPSHARTGSKPPHTLNDCCSDFRIVKQNTQSFKHLLLSEDPQKGKDSLMECVSAVL